ncbi:hypothetical protein [Pseudaquabacterium pictum]|uniref:Uncharacterized protein n=1 Tax=Pseudaquabacterium pictum TaxID=2315236 RepID=A0A480ART1_9BURK|nr:hypothetical protein [Rubrivivax pictus]GCL64359.1 hypothetical protein AQPW35_34400 [Rubrivivax pictus]
MFETNSAWLLFWFDAFQWVFPAFIWGATTLAVLGVWICIVHVARLALLRTLEVVVIVEAAREAKRQGRSPILRAWTRLDRRWGNGS